LLIPDTPPEISRDLLVVKEDDERTVSTIDSAAKDVSLNRQITQAIRHAPFASTSSTTSKELLVNDQTTLWSGCNGYTGDDMLSFTHMCKAISEVIECLYAGQRGGYCLANKAMNDSVNSSIAKDDISKSSSPVSFSKKERDSMKCLSALGAKDKEAI
jgi:hypothetical protein